MLYFSFFFFNDTATTEIYTLSLHDALPIFRPRLEQARHVPRRGGVRDLAAPPGDQRDPGTPHDARHRTGTLLRCRDRKSTRLNSSHSQISYAVFCLKKKKYISKTSQPLLDI